MTRWYSGFPKEAVMASKAKPIEPEIILKDGKPSAVILPLERAE